MSDTPSKRFDVAFSFRYQDLSEAMRLADALLPLDSFVYARKQEELATQDGMVRFAEVFGTESRLNVMLYRAGYGERGWTNFEAEIIKGRCLTGDWESLALVILDGSAKPVWLPPAYIYADAQTLGFDELVGVIKYRAKAVGAPVRNEAAADRLARLARTKAFDAETDRIATGGEAIDQVDRNFVEICERVAQGIEDAGNLGPAFESASGRDNTVFGAKLGQVSVLINYQRPYFRANGVTLMFRYFDGQLAIPGTREVNWGLPDEVSRTLAAAVRTPALGWCWSFENKPRTSAEIAEIVLDTLIRHIK